MTISIFTVKKVCLKSVHFSTELFHCNLPLFASCFKIRTESSECERGVNLHFLQDETANSLSVHWKNCVCAAYNGNTTSFSSHFSARKDEQTHIVETEYFVNVA